MAATTSTGPVEALVAACGSDPEVWGTLDPDTQEALFRYVAGQARLSRARIAALEQRLSRARVVASSVLDALGDR